MNQSYDPINEAIIQGNFGETPDHETTINLSPEDVIDGHSAELVQAPRRGLVLPAVAASLVLLAGIGGGAYYVMSTADPEPEAFAALASESNLPLTPTQDGLPAANSTVPGVSEQGQAPQASPTNPFGPPPVTDAVTAPATETAATPAASSVLPTDLAALASGAAPATSPPPVSVAQEPSHASQAVAEPIVAAQPVKAASATASVSVPKPETKPEPKATPKPKAPAPAAAKPAPVKAETPRKIVTTPVAQAPVASNDGEAVKPLIVMTAQQIGLKSLTREGLVVASASGAESKTYRQGSVLPSGERVVMLDAAAMVIVTDRNVIRITP